MDANGTCPSWCDTVNLLELVFTVAFIADVVVLAFLVQALKRLAVATDGLIKRR